MDIVSASIPQMPLAAPSAAGRKGLSAPARDVRSRAMFPAIKILVDVAIFRLKKLEMANIFAAVAIMLLDFFVTYLLG